MRRKGWIGKLYKGGKCVKVIVEDLFLFKQKTAYEMRISDWSSDVCSSDLLCPYVEPRLPCRAAAVARRAGRCAGGAAGRSSVAAGDDSRTDRGACAAHAAPAGASADRRHTATALGGEGCAQISPRCTPSLGVGSPGRPPQPVGRRQPP